VTAATVLAYAPPAVAALRTPDPEAPFDDSLPTVRGATWALPEHVPRPPRLRLVKDPEPEEEDDVARFDYVRTPREELDDPRPRAATFVRALLETLMGDRPVGQFERWTTPDVFDDLGPLVAARERRPGRVALRRLYVAEPTPGVAEVTAVVQQGPRAGAVALRLEGLDGRWLVTALQLG
jgi:hypothetical protein